MRYQTVSEYFYRFYSVLFLIVLVPLGVLVYLYIEASRGGIHHPLSGSEEALFIVYGLAGLIFIDWIITSVLFARALKNARALVSLGERLDKYYAITLTRFLLLGNGLLCLVIGFYLVGDQLLTALFIISLLLLGLVWPFPYKVSRDLALKEEERRVLSDWK